MIFVGQITPNDRIRVAYCIIPITTKPRQHKLFSLIEPMANYDNIIGQPYTYNPFSKKGDALSFNDLQYAGVFSRGISLGNNQDLILNSNFNLQLSGKIGDIDVVGSLSDNNIPLQPAGNTQQLQDFDRIFIEFSYKKNKLKAGDFDLRSPRSLYFTRYFRRLKVVIFSPTLRSIKKYLSKLVHPWLYQEEPLPKRFYRRGGESRALSITRRKMVNYLIIIAGSERVFIDGQLMKEVLTMIILSIIIWVRSLLQHAR